MKYTYKKKEYYNLLINLCKENKLFVSDSAKQGFDEIFEKGKKELSIDFFEKDCISEFGVGYGENAINNYIKYNLWTLEFCKNLNNNAMIKTSILFNILCCVIDTVLDHEIDGKIENARKLTDWDQIGCFYQGDVYEEKDNIMDFMMNYISIAFSKMIDIDKKHTQEIIGNVKNALASELYVSKKIQLKDYRHLEKEQLINKSTKFIIACHQIAGFRTDDWDRMSYCASLIGEIFMLVDDIGDLYEDIENGFTNSILYENFQMDCLNKSIEVIMHKMPGYIKKIRENLELLKSETNEEIYWFYLQEVSDWYTSIIQDNLFL